MENEPMRKLYERIRLAQEGNQAETEELVEENMGLVYALVRKMSGRGAETEDLIQMGAIGLFKAIQNFKADFGVKFSTYAVPMILGEMKRYLRDDGPVKLSRSVKTMALKAYAVRDRLFAVTGREPSVTEIAEELGTDAQELAAAMEAAHAPESFYTPCGENESFYLIDRLRGGVSEESGAVDRIVLSELIGKLPPREQKILILRYFKDETQSKIAARLGISQVQVSRLEKKILGRLREFLSPGDGKKAQNEKTN